MSKLARNEQRKLTATYLNGVAIAFVAIGVLAPAVSLLNGVGSNLVAEVVVAVACGSFSTALHYLARRILSGLEE